MRNITAVDTFTDPVTVLEDGDPVVAASSEPTAQALTNRTEHLKNLVDAIGERDTADGFVGLDANRHAVIAAAGGSNVTALTGTGDGTGAGLEGTGGATAPGVKGTGGASSGAGVDGTGGAAGTSGVKGTGGATSGKGVEGIGTGSGAGVAGTGGTTGAGVTGSGGGSGGAGVAGTGVAAAAAGVTGQGGPSAGVGVSGTGGASSGTGVLGTGGGTNGDGVQGQGTGSGDGVQGTGGATSGAIGVRGIGGSSNGIGVRGDGTGTGVGGYFDGAGTGTGASDDAVELAQNIKFSGSNPAASTGFSNRLTKLNLPKAWGKATANGSGGFSSEDAFNGTWSIQGTPGSQYLRFTFATAMADTNYSVVCSGPIAGGASTWYTVTGNRTTGQFDVQVYDNSGNLVNFGSGGNSGTFNVIVFGRQ